MTNSSNVGGGAQGAATKDENINVMVFENAEFGPVRTLVDTNGDPLFCGKDVCDALGYAKTDKAVREHVNNLDVLKQYLKVPGSLRKDGTRTMRSQMMLFVNESGFYCLVFGSKLEAAQRFKRWVTSEVLPSIRKNGYYSMIQMKNKLIDEQTSRIHELDKMMGEQLVRLQKSAEELLSQEAYIDRLLPKSLYTDNVLDSISCYTTTQIAKELGCTAQELNRSLCASHIQYYQSGQYMLYADYAHMGLAKSRTHYKAVMEPRNMDPKDKVGRIYTHTYLVWTERGRKFIHDLAKQTWALAELEEARGK